MVYVQYKVRQRQCAKTALLIQMCLIIFIGDYIRFIFYSDIINNKNIYTNQL